MYRQARHRVQLVKAGGEPRRRTQSRLEAQQVDRAWRTRGTSEAYKGISVPGGIPTRRQTIAHYRGLNGTQGV